MIDRDDLTKYLNTLLKVEQFKDYGPNGLQVEGKAKIEKIVYGVTASLALIEKAIELKADAVIVHHGLFWRGQDGRVVGWMKRRLQELLVNDVNLYGFHLPLDAQSEFGNNAMLGCKLGLNVHSFLGDPPIVALGEMVDHSAMSLQVLSQKLQTVLDRAVTVVAGDGRMLKRIAWCTGGAQGYFEDAIAAGADVYITGEISEPQAHYARETGVAFIAAGHHATERFGIQGLAKKVSEDLGIDGTYIEVDNPA